MRDLKKCLDFNVLLHFCKLIIFMFFFLVFVILVYFFSMLACTFLYKKSRKYIYLYMKIDHNFFFYQCIIQTQCLYNVLWISFVCLHFSISSYL